MSWGAKLTGLNTTLNTFKQIQTNWTGDALYIVGSNAEYALWVEVGTTRMEPQPFLRPAVNDWNRDPDAYIQKHTNHSGDFDSLEDMIRVSALAIERDASERAPVDTGNLQGSVESQKIR